jgi:hypothetical protein
MSAACDITRPTCDASYAALVGAASVPPAGRWSATKKRLRTGNDIVGRRLKKGLREGRTIVFVDKSGLSERPYRVRTWAPRGQTPVLRFFRHIVQAANDNRFPRRHLPQ